MQINTFKGYTIFGLEKDNTPKKQIESDTNAPSESEVTENVENYEQLTINSTEPAIAGAGSTEQSDTNTPQYATSLE